MLRLKAADGTATAIGRAHRPWASFINGRGRCKADFKKTCRDTQIEHIKGFDLELVLAKGDFVTVRWLCHTTNGKAFRDVEIHRLRDLKIAALECYSAGPAGFPTAVESSGGPGPAPPPDG